MAANQGDESRVDRLRIHNSLRKTLDFTIEPWGDLHPMASGDVFEVVATGPAEGFFEVDTSEKGLTIYGWPGSVVNVFRDGKELGAGVSARQPIPPVPPGKSIKDIVGWMNKKTSDETRE